jgi:hypothetical protein
MWLVFLWIFILIHFGCDFDVALALDRMLVPGGLVFFRATTTMKGIHDATTMHLTFTFTNITLHFLFSGHIRIQWWSWYDLLRPLLALFLWFPCFGLLGQSFYFLPHWLVIYLYKLMDGDDHIWYWYRGMDTLHGWKHVELFHSCDMDLHSCFIVPWSILMHACQSSNFWFHPYGFDGHLIICLTV